MFQKSQNYVIDITNNQIVMSLMMHFVHDALAYCHQQYALVRVPVHSEKSAQFIYSICQIFDYQWTFHIMMWIMHQSWLLGPQY